MKEALIEVVDLKMARRIIKVRLAPIAKTQEELKKKYSHPIGWRCKEVAWKSMSSNQ